MSKAHILGRLLVALKVAICLLVFIMIIIKPEPIIAFVFGAILGVATGIIADMIVMRKENETNPD